MTGIMEAARRLNDRVSTVVLVTHDHELLRRYATRMVVLERGRIVAQGRTRRDADRPGGSAVRLTLKELTVIGALGALWGSVELSVGSFVHVWNLPLGGAVLAAFGVTVALSPGSSCRARAPPSCLR